MRGIARVAMVAAAVALLAAGASFVPAGARVVGTCTGKATYDLAKKEKATSQGVAWAMASDEQKPQSCFYKARKGEHTYVLTSLNAWEIWVYTDGKPKPVKPTASAPGSLEKRQPPAKRGAVKVTEGQIIEIRVVPGCQSGRCGGMIQLAMGTR